MAAKREEFLARANAIKKELEGKETREIRKRMEEAEIPMPVIDEVAPQEKEAPKDGKDAKPAPAKK